MITEYNYKRPLSEYCYEEVDHYGGVQKLYQFDNKMGASVIRHQGSYGYKQGKWELAVLDEEGNLDYSTEITNDVIGHLEWKEVSALLRRIQAL